MPCYICAEQSSVLLRSHSSRRELWNGLTENVIYMQVHRIPVVDSQAKLVGIVTRTDIFTALEGSS